MNGLYAFALIFVIYAIGDMVATKTKAVISMMLVASFIFAIGFWNGLPSTIFADSALQSVANVGVGLLLVHMGTTINLRDLLKEWKTVVLVIVSTVAICLSVFFIGKLFIDEHMALIGAPILGGGIVAFLIMSDVMENIGDSIVLFGSLVLIFQSVAGLPLASLLCKKEGYRLREKIRSGDLYLTEDLTDEDDSATPRHKLFPIIPEKYHSDNYTIAKLALVASLASWLSDLTGGKVNMLIICLVLGVIFSEIGFLEESALIKANGFTLIIGATLVNAFSSLANTTPIMLISMIKPLLIVIVVGLAFCAIFSILMGKIFKLSWYMSFAMGVTALVGFPGTFIVSNEVSKAVGETPEEQEIILQQILPKMIISGMVSVSIVSVIFAGIMVGWV